MSNEGLLAFLNSLGLPGIRKSPIDFTATYASATTLTLTGLPSVPQIWLGVWEIPVAGLPKFWAARDNAFSFVSATGVLTVAGASFVNGSTFAVLYADKHVAYDSVLDALQTVVMNAVQWDFVDSQTVLSAANMASGIQDTGWIYVKGLTSVRLDYIWVSGAGAGDHHLLCTVYGNNTDAGTTEYEDEQNTLGTTVAGAALTTNRSEAINVEGHVRVKFKFDESGGTGKGTITCAVLVTNA